MMCVNVNSPEFKEFAKDYDNPLIAEIEYGLKLSQDETAIEELKAMTSKHNKKAALKYAQAFTEQLGVPHQVVSYADAQKILGNNPVSAGFFVGGKVYLVDTLFDKDTVFHEFAHPIIMALGESDRPLFESLYTQLFNTDLGQQIIEQVKTNEPRLLSNEYHFKQECLVRALDKMKSDASQPNSWYNNFLFSVKQFLRKIFGKKIDVSKLSSDTTLNDFLSMINAGQKFILKTEFITDDDVIFFQKKYRETIDEIDANKKQEADALVKKTFDYVKEALADLQKQNSPYSVIAGEITNEELDSPFQQYHSVLKSLNLDRMSTNEQAQKLNPYNYIQDPQMYAEEVRRYENKLMNFVEQFGLFEATVNNLADVLDKLVSQNTYSLEDVNRLLAIDKYFQVWQKIHSAMQVSAFSEMKDITDKINTSGRVIAKSIQKVNEFRADLIGEVLYNHLKDEYEQAFSEMEADLKLYEDNKSGKTYRNLYEQLYNMTPEETQEFEDLKQKEASYKANNNQLPIVEAERLLILKLKNSEKVFFDKESFIDQIKYNTRQADTISRMFTNSMNQADMTVQGLVSFIEKRLNQANANYTVLEANFRNKFNAAKKGTSLEKMDVEEIGRYFSQIEERSKSNSSDIIEVHQFLNNFTGWEKELRDLTDKLSKASDEYTNNPTDANLKLKEDAQIELQKFKIENMHQEGVEAVYRYEHMLHDDIGREAVRQRNKAFESIQLLLGHNLALNSDPAIQAEVKKLWAEYKQIASIYDIYGNEKTGREREIAERLSDYNNLTSEFYQWNEKTGTGSFDNAYLQYKELLADDLSSGTITQDEYDKKLEQWILSNSVVAVDESFYDYRTQLIEERSRLMAPVIQMNNSIKDLGPLYEEIYALLKPVKDTNNGYHDGTMLSKDVQEKIRKISEEIRDAKLDFVSKSGLTKKEHQKLEMLKAFYKAHNKFPDPITKGVYDTLIQKQTHGLSLIGITSSMMKRIEAIDSILSSLTKSESTPVYLDTLQSMFLKDTALLAEVEQTYFYKTGFNIDLTVDTLSDSIWELFLADTDVITDLKLISPDFEEWFDRNHYEDDVFLQNSKLGTWDVHYGYKKTSAWSFSSPQDVSYYQSKTVKDSQGNIVDVIQHNGIPRVPSMSYRMKELKDEHKTEIIERDYKDSNGKLVLATVSNKGASGGRPSFLPRANANSRFINKRYQNLFDNNQDHWEVLQVLKDYTLDIQKGLDNEQKLYLDFPRVRKEGVEVYGSGYIQNKLDDMAFWKQKEDEYEYGFRTYDSEMSSDFNLVKRPVTGMYNLDLGFVSTNITRTLGRYNKSVQYYKASRTSSSLAYGLKQLIEMIETDEASAKNQVISDYKKENSSDKQRLNSINDKIDKLLQATTYNRNASPLIANRTVNAYINSAQKRARFRMFNMDNVKAFKNFFAGEFGIITKFSKYANIVDYLYGISNGARITKQMLLDNKSGKLSPLTQVAYIFQLGPDVLNKQAGKVGSIDFSKSKRVVNLLKNSAYALRNTLNNGTEAHILSIVLHKDGYDLNDFILDDEGRVVTKDHIEDSKSISYDAEGNIVLGEEIHKTIRKSQAFLKETLGTSNEVYGLEAERFAFAKILLFVQKFLPNIIEGDYGNVRNVFKKKGKQLNVNLMTGSYGYSGDYSTLLAYTIKLIQGDVRKFGVKEQIATLKVAKYTLIFYLMGYLVSLLKFNDNDEDELARQQNEDIPIFNYDAKKEGIHSQLKRSTAVFDPIGIVANKFSAHGHLNRIDWSDYARLHALNLINQTMGEFNMSNPLVAGNTVTQFMTEQGAGIQTFVNDLNIIYHAFGALVDSDNARYKQVSGPLKWQEKDDLKITNDFWKQLGVNGSIVSPAHTIERNSKFLIEPMK